jgi:hypothetical protein
VPDFDEQNASIVRGIRVGNKEMIADLVGGQIQNLRPHPGTISFSIDGTGKMQADTSSVDQSVLAAATAAIATQLAAAPLAVNSLTAMQA